ncbi:MAG TPA: DMT family transporter [Ideonella sp.]|uniref:DMT family transporter n=1 Tax=Ideonella sp. TaxID=1929293 RepID=UPI002E35BCDB|nr:DMT family transporter [Ideonella sp.]HEX5683595.1 DMT family transporter [Ideonella sp.]
MTHSSSTAAMAAACGAAFLWGTGALVVNLLIAKFGLSPESISFWRFVVGAVLLVALFGRPAHWPRLRSQAWLLIGAGACMALYVLCWFLGIARIGAAVPTLIALCLPPVLVTLVAVLRGRETLDVPLVATLLAALVGTTLVVLRHGGLAAGAETGTVVAGVLFSVASAVLYAGFTLVSGRLSQALGAGPATMGLTVVAAAVMGLSVLYAPLAWPDDIPPEAWLLYLGLVTAALALLAFSWGAARLTPTALTVATLVEPLTAVLLAALLLGQALSASQWLGAVLMLASIAALGKRDAERSAAVRASA